MRLLPLVAFVIFPFSCLAAKKSSENRFETYHSKSLSSSPLKLDDAAYQLLTSAPRDYAVAVLLTALEARYGCQMCRDFHPEWELIAKSWTKGDRRGSNRVLYGTLDFADGKATFQKVGTSVSRCSLHTFQSSILFNNTDLLRFSLCFKRHRFCFFSHLLLDLVLRSMVSLFVMTLPLGPSND